MVNEYKKPSLRTWDRAGIMKATEEVDFAENRPFPQRISRFHHVVYRVLHGMGLAAQS